MKQVGILANPQKSNVRAVTRQMLAWSRELGFVPLLEESLARAVEASEAGCQERDLLQHSDFFVALGGDGTLLRTAHLVREGGIPILGINLGGSLGFLMQTRPEELRPFLARVLAGQYSIEERMGLMAQVEHDGPEYFALNDIVVDKGHICRVIKIALFIDEEQLNVVVADGMIVASPTGSTAYALAAGGPVVDPRMEMFVMAPICPHTLSIRPMIIAPDKTIALRITSDHEENLMTIDGQKSLFIKSQQTVRIRKAPFRIRLIRCETRSFYGILRNKFKWGDR